MKKPKAPEIRTLNADMLSDELKAQLRVKAKERVEKARTEAAEDAYLKEVIRQEELADKPEEQIEYVFLDLAGHTEYIMLDGVRFFHGQTYEVTKSVADSMREVVARGWDHEDEVGMANRGTYRKPMNTPRDLNISPRHANQSANSILGR